jgi:hypothetical protein
MPSEAMIHLVNPTWNLTYGERKLSIQQTRELMMSTRLHLLATATFLLSLTAIPALAAQDNKSNSEQRPDLTSTQPTGTTIPGTATTTPQAAGDQGSVSSNNQGAANARQSAPGRSSSPR